MRRIDQVVDAFRKLGGAGRMEDVYKYFEVTAEEELPRTWREGVRARIYEHSSDAPGDFREDLFEKIEHGFWKLRGAPIESGLIEDRRDLSADEVVEKVLVREHWRSKPQQSLWRNQAFTITHADDGKFEGAGLRPFFEYRDLGIKEATQGKFGAHIIRAVPGMESPATWHSHDLAFQMVYVTQGWVVFEYEGTGEHVLRAGSCVLQPPGIKHREVRHSDDLELLEVISPADFDTRDEDAP
ncbi:cupin domain-containing protein [uncultured Roseobacter sp.]|uniref:cupin domain-containing protein n=1 Tax=uncultured Roseobacter sp. TaxID=114847 RepID=UPI0026140458|nr:cupin domain-containing protein [uncultured Roseobacter sp.]